MTTALRRLCLAGLFLGAACGTKTPTAPADPPATTTAPTPASNGLHFTVSPIDIASIVYITSLGNMAPWGHTLPTDHIYFYHHAGNDPYPPAPVYAPAGGRIESISAGPSGRIDVRVNSEFSYYVGPLTYADGIVSGAQVLPGTLLGRHSTFPAFDFSVLRTTLHLNLINPARYSPDTLMADGPMQYFDEPVRSAILPKVLRSGGQIDGRIDYDVSGTLSGNWFAEDLPVADSGKGGDIYYGTRKLAFAHDVFSPDRQRVSVGGLGMTGLYATTDDAPDFVTVTPASGLVVLRMMAVGEPQGPPTNLQVGWLLVQVLDAGRLRVEAVPLPFTVAVSVAGPAPIAFSDHAELYLR